MAQVRPWTSWKPYRFFSMVEWRCVALEYDSIPGVPIDNGSIWVERRVVKFIKRNGIEYHKKEDGWLRIDVNRVCRYLTRFETIRLWIGGNP